MTGADTAMIITIVVILGILIFLAVAEMGLSKMTKPRAAAIAEEHPRAGASLQMLVEQPERWINPLLLSVNICQTVQATLTGIVAGRRQCNGSSCQRVGARVGLVGSAVQGERRIVFVFTGLQSPAERRQEAEAMINWGFRQFLSKSLASAGDVVSEIPVWLGDHQLMAAGQPLPFDRPAASAYMRDRAAGAYLSDDTVFIRLQVGPGVGRGSAWGCDLSDQYVRINADYTT